MVIGHAPWCSCTPRSVLAATLASCISMLSWGKVEPATRPSKTILHDALNGQTATGNPNSRQLRLTHVAYVDIVGHALYNIHGWQGGWVMKLYVCTLFIIDGLGQRGPRRCRFLEPKRRLFSEIATLIF